MDILNGFEDVRLILKFVMKMMKSMWGLKITGITTGVGDDGCETGDIVGYMDGRDGVDGNGRNGSYDGVGRDDYTNDKNNGDDGCDIGSMIGGNDGWDGGDGGRNSENIGDDGVNDIGNGGNDGICDDGCNIGTIFYCGDGRNGGGGGRNRRNIGGMFSCNNSRNGGNGGRNDRDGGHGGGNCGDGGDGGSGNGSDGDVGIGNNIGGMLGCNDGQDRGDDGSYSHDRGDENYGKNIGDSNGDERGCGINDDVSRMIVNKLSGNIKCFCNDNNNGRNSSSDYGVNDDGSSDGNENGNNGGANDEIDYGNDCKDYANSMKRIKTQMLLGLLNIRSILSKSDVVREILLEGLDFLVLVETWHGYSDNISIKLTMPSGYHFLDFLRPYDPYHDGLIIFFRSNFKYKKIDLPCFSTFEVLAIKFFINGIDWVLVSLYRPGSQQVKTIFFQELVFMMEHVLILTSRILLAGDFNIHVERTDDAHTISLLEVFDMFQMVNNVNGSTHDLGETLDLIVSSLGFPVQTGSQY
ncbi:hypothetical protein HELRODRAFT_165410 [Helobdella robusta]|uniref:Endonuclease/exonuclease/phosphatase domain-containing protein n=1 Tax=Helobdella robusta TaxID=6412 RepID=T1EWQ8_HELRO|nr:hypothetical protein HELRODRAFT_165410 [Helobdella robusta]ESN91381.1 hypothetical protein HELRODRAFT_165410 [Helobdella robusta]